MCSWPITFHTKTKQSPSFQLRCAWRRWELIEVKVDNGVSELDVSDLDNSWTRCFMSRAETEVLQPRSWRGSPFSTHLLATSSSLGTRKQVQWTSACPPIPFFFYTWTGLLNSWAPIAPATAANQVHAILMEKIQDNREVCSTDVNLPQNMKTTNEDRAVAQVY
jgi:hypothetical protein